MNKLVLCAALFGLLSLASLALAKDSEVDVTLAKFTEFTRRFDRKYKSMDEFLSRYAIFQENLEKIAKLNSNGGNKFGINKFADVSAEEFKALFTGYKRNARHLSRAKTLKPRRDAVPDTFDWRDQKAVTPVKDQGQCGSCWAFSTVEEIESMWFLSNGTLPILAPQQIVDCDTVDQGCNGGDTVTAYQYVESAGGLEPESDYPYTAVGGTCNSEASEFIAKISGFNYATPACTDGTCDSQDEDTLQSNLAQTGPVSICVDAEIWQTYTGGVLEASDNCAHDSASLDHCVQLVGYNTDSTGTYWIVRNSWNTNWGDSGYIYLRKGSNVCGVADEATIAQI